MNCMRCGREIPLDQVFCSECLENMKRHPVKPGVVIQLPKREEDVFLRRPAKHVSVTPEKQLERVRQRSRLISTFLILLVLLAAAVGFLSGMHLERHRIIDHMGQNYSTSESTEESKNVSRETSDDRR